MLIIRFVAGLIKPCKLSRSQPSRWHELDEVGAAGCVPPWRGTDMSCLASRGRCVLMKRQAALYTSRTLIIARNLFQETDKYVHGSLAVLERSSIVLQKRCTLAPVVETMALRRIIKMITFINHVITSYRLRLLFQTPRI